MVVALRASANLLAGGGLSGSDVIELQLNCLITPLDINVDYWRNKTPDSIDVGRTVTARKVDAEGRSIAAFHLVVWVEKGLHRVASRCDVRETGVGEPIDAHPNAVIAATGKSDGILVGHTVHVLAKDQIGGGCDICVFERVRSARCEQDHNPPIRAGGQEVLCEAELYIELGEDRDRQASREDKRDKLAREAPEVPHDEVERGWHKLPEIISKNGRVHINTDQPYNSAVENNTYGSCNPRQQTFHNPGHSNRKALNTLPSRSAIAVYTEVEKQRSRKIGVVPS